MGVWSLVGANVIDTLNGNGTYEVDFLATAGGGVIDEEIVQGTYTVQSGIWTETPTEFSCPSAAYPPNVGACVIAADGDVVSVDSTSNSTAIWAPVTSSSPVDAATTNVGCFTDYPSIVGFTTHPSLSPVE